MLIRYVPYNKNVDDWEITERFLEFKDFYKKTGSEIAGIESDRECAYGSRDRHQ